MPALVCPQISRFRGLTHLPFAHAATAVAPGEDLGVFGKQMVDGEGGVGGDLALVGTLFVVVLVGTFASQVCRVFFFFSGGSSLVAGRRGESLSPQLPCIVRRCLGGVRLYTSGVLA